MKFKKLLFILLTFIVPNIIYGTEQGSALNIAEQVEKNLIYSKEIIRNPEDDIIINRGKWDKQMLEEADNISQDKKIEVKAQKVKEDKRLTALKQKAYDAINIGQYEIAVKLYKQVLEKDRKDTYAILGLATAYQYLGDYLQAKPLFLDIIDKFPDDQQIMANLLNIMIQESPYEAVYLISNIADKNTNSHLFQAQASLAYTKIKNYDKAIDYIEKALSLDNNNVEYKYNLAVLYDLTGNLTQAKNLYTDVLDYYASNNNIIYNLPVEEVKRRVELLSLK